MASYDPRKESRQAAGRQAPIEFTFITLAAASTNVAVTDRLGNNIFGEDMILNVLDLTAHVDRRADFSVTSAGNVQSSTGSGSGNPALLVWRKFHLNGLG